MVWSCIILTFAAQFYSSCTGMTTVEHAIPVPALYEDVLTLYALSGTGATPTHIVNYGGAWGEQLVWATNDIPNDPKYLTFSRNRSPSTNKKYLLSRLRRFTRHDILEGLSESTARPVSCTSAEVTKEYIF